MNIAATQASGLQSIFDRLTPPPIERDREVMKLKQIATILGETRPHMENLAGKNKPRLEELSALADYIKSATLLECKFIVNELIDRVSELTGSAQELEEVAAALTAAMEYEPHEPRCKCDGCRAARSDEAYDRWRDARDEA